MVFKRLLNSLIFIGFSFLIIGCSATNEQLNEDQVSVVFGGIPPTAATFAFTLPGYSE